MEECQEVGSGKLASVITKKPPKNELSPYLNEKPVAPLPISTSAQDLTALETEREKVDESSPTEDMRDYVRSLEPETCSSNASTSDDVDQSNSHSHLRGFFRLLKSKSMRRLSTIPPMRVPKLSRRHSRSVKENQVSTFTPQDDIDFSGFKASWKNFTLSQLQIATNNFSSDNLIGQGGYAEVYKGCLPDGLIVAVKRLTNETLEQTVGNFLSELGIIAHVDHPNTAKLVGYGIEGGMHIVLKFSQNGSLASILRGPKEKLDWSIRYKIVLGTAEGLLYLHEGCQRRIIHRDIKASNILLTDEFEPQISDFGLAKWLPKQWTHLTVSKFEGTLGYLAPEYFMHGVVDEKIDVFSFGVLLLELVTGRRALDSTQQSLVLWAKPLLDENDTRELVDPSIGDNYNREEMNRVLLTASLCIQQSSILRPQMSQVVQLLRDRDTSMECMKKFKKPIFKRTYSVELFDAEEYNSTRYLSDLTRHKQIALLES